MERAWHDVHVLALKAIAAAAMAFALPPPSSASAAPRKYPSHAAKQTPRARRERRRILLKEPNKQKGDAHG